MVDAMAADRRPDETAHERETAHEHEHKELPWRVRVESERGELRGAGVLLSDRHVVTCAHNLGRAGAAAAADDDRPAVRIASTVCRPEWTRIARVVRGTWVYRGSERGDVALLELDEPTPCGAATTLWRAPLSGGKVRAYGFPRVEPFGIPVDAELAGVGGREGEWGTLLPLVAGRQWIEPGFSGAGVLALEGPFDGRVIGIVVRDFVNGEAKAAWMLPTETMLTHIPQLKPYVAGVPTSVLPVPPGAARPGADVVGSLDPDKLAMARELAELLRSGWSGTAVVTGGAATGTGWLTGLLLTADPAARARAAEQTTAARRGAVLDFGSVDAAIDAARRTAAEVRGYLAERFGFGGAQAELGARLLRRKPPCCLAICSVDRCLEPEALIDSLLLDLARQARWRGIRLVLGFDGEPPSGLPYQVALGPVTGTVHSGPEASKSEAQAAIEQLRAAEADAGTRHREWELRLSAPPRLPRRAAPQLGVRFAVAQGISDRRARAAEYAAIRDAAVAAFEEVRRFGDAMDGSVGLWQELGRTLELYRERARRAVDAEDPELTRLYSRALRSLRRLPIDLRHARAEVARYVDAVNRRFDDGTESAEGRRG
jgi:hypothetical protein